MLAPFIIYYILKPVVEDVKNSSAFVTWSKFTHSEETFGWSVVFSYQPCVSRHILHIVVTFLSLRAINSKQCTYLPPLNWELRRLFLEGFMYLHNHLIKEKFLGSRGQSSVAFLGLPWPGWLRTSPDNYPSSNFDLNTEFWTKSVLHYIKVTRY